jgi:RNA polymerase-associated protein
MTMIKRTVMTLYSGSEDVYSHQVRLVLAEKGVSVDIIVVDAYHPCEELVELNPYNSLPTLVDRELILYQPQVIMEYLDERFPHPPLLPVYPVSRARSRLMMYRIERDWYSLYHKILAKDPKSEEYIAELRAGLMELSPVFADMPYFLSEDYTMVDCCLAPLLWRLPSLGIKFPRQAKPLLKYAERVFERETFKASLSEAESEFGGDDFK